MPRAKPVAKAGPAATTRAILFDLDNTLIDFMRMKRLSCEAAVDAMIKAGLKADRKRTLDLLFDLYDRHGYEYKGVFQDLMKEMTGNVDYGIVGAGIVAYRKAREGLLVSYPDVLPTINALRRKGIKLAIVTDAPRIEAWIRLAAIGIQNRFDAVIAFDDSRVKKPSLKPLRMALRRLRVKSPHDAMVVGDSMSKDMVPASKMGMKSVLAEYGRYKKAKGKTDHRIKRFRELLNLV